jgi:hypothetical protein
MFCLARNNIGTMVVTPLSFYAYPDPAFSKGVRVLIWIPKLTMTNSVKNTKRKMTNSAVPVRNIANILVQIKIMLTCHIVHMDLGSQIQQLYQTFHVLQLEHTGTRTVPIISGKTVVYSIPV